MLEKQNQSVRYSKIMTNFSKESFETKSIPVLLTKKNEINSSKRNRMLFGLVTFVVYVLIVSIVTMLSSKKNLIKTVINQNKLMNKTANSFATTMLSTLEIAEFLPSRKPSPQQPAKNNDSIARRNISTTMDAKNC